MKGKTPEAKTKSIWGIYIFIAIKSLKLNRQRETVAPKKTRRQRRAIDENRTNQKTEEPDPENV